MLRCFQRLLFCLAAGLAVRAARVDFNRDVRPLLADTCFRCHGFDAGPPEPVHDRRRSCRTAARPLCNRPDCLDKLPIPPSVNHPVKTIESALDHESLTFVIGLR